MTSPSHQIDPHCSHLVSCQVVLIGSTPLIRSGAVDTLEKADELYFLARQIGTPPDDILHVSSCQVSSMEFEAESIQKQHLSIFNSNQNRAVTNSILHLSFPMEKLYRVGGPGQQFKRVAEALEILPKWLNMEAWAELSALYYLKLEQRFSQFKYDDIDQYTLEGHIKDLQHEVSSYFLAKASNELHQLLFNLSKLDQHHEYQDILKIDKEIIVIQGELQKMVKAHYDILMRIIQTILIIQQSHPELAALQTTAKILAGLLGDQVQAQDAYRLDWGARQILLQLLNQELGIVSALNGERGLARTSLAFSLRLAVLQLLRQYPVDAIADLAFAFIETSKIKNKIAAKEGIEGYKKWIKQDKGNNEESLHIRRAMLLDNLQKNLYLNALQFSKPLAELQQKMEEPGQLKENLALLPYLPFELVLVNRDTGEPIGLTEQGHQFMKAL